MEPTLTKQVVAIFTDGTEQAWQFGDSHGKDFIETAINRWAQSKQLTIDHFTVEPIAEQPTDLHDLHALAQATREARDRTGVNYSTRVKRGRVQLVIAAKALAGKYEITPVSDYVSVNDAIAGLDGMEAP